MILPKLISIQVPLMSAKKLMEIVPHIVKSAEAAVAEIQPNQDIETKELAGHYTIRSIMSSTFGIGNSFCATNFKHSDATEKATMDLAIKHASGIIPENVSLFKFMLLGLIPEKIRFALNLTTMPADSLRYFEQLWSFMFSDTEKPACLTVQMAKNLISEDQKLDESVTKGFTKHEVMSNSMGVILAGYETVASSLQFIIFRLCKELELQEELHKLAIEIDVQNYDQVRDFKLLDAFIKGKVLNSVNWRYFSTVQNQFHRMPQNLPARFGQHSILSGDN